MARHSQFANIKHRKEAGDKIRGKIFTMHARLIAVAARSGGDPAMNPLLRAAIDRAREANVPNANIERAIKKGTGEDKEGALLEEITYEAFGPGGSAFLIDTISDNKNRTLLNIRTVLSKNGGNLASAGSVAWKFSRKAYFFVDVHGAASEEVELNLIDCGAEDLERTTEGDYEVYAAPEQCFEVKKKIEIAGYGVKKVELVWKPKEELKVEDLSLAQSILSLSDLLEEEEDTVRVTTNVNFDETLLSQLR